MFDGFAADDRPADNHVAQVRIHILVGGQNVEPGFNAKVRGNHLGQCRYQHRQACRSFTNDQGAKSV